MAKKKFVERRRQKAAIKCRTWLDARRCRDSISELLRSHGVVFETHWSEDENDEYSGFDRSWDCGTDRTWYVIENPHGGSPLELAIDSCFDIRFGCACWSFHPNPQGYEGFREMISSVLCGRAASVSCLIDGEDVSHAILVGELMNESDMRLLERIAERDYWGTNQDIYYKDDFNVSIELKKRLRKLRSRNGWSASYEFWNPQMNKVISFSKS